MNAQINSSELVSVGSEICISQYNYSTYMCVETYYDSNYQHDG